MAKENHLTLDDWADMWDKGHTGWHEPTGNSALKEHLPPVLKKVYGDQVPTDLKVLVPLCGKSRDLLVLYSLGYHVVGTEYTQAGIDEFFRENNLDKCSDAPKQFTMTKDQRLTLIRGDHYKTVSECLPFPIFDIIWDRGAFEAINREDRHRYAKQMMSILRSETGVYFLQTMQYDKSEYGGPPFAATQEDIQEYFSQMTVEPIATRDVLKPGLLEAYMYFKDVGVTKMDETVFLLQSI